MCPCGIDFGPTMGGRRREEAGRRRPAVPGLAVAQLRRRDGGIRFGRGVVKGDGRCDGGVRLGRRVVGREGRRNCGVPLGHSPVGQQRVGDGREGGVRLGRRVVGREGCRNCGVPLDRRFEGPWCCNRPAGCPCSLWTGRWPPRWWRSLLRLS